MKTLAKILGLAAGLALILCSAAVLHADTNTVAAVADATPYAGAETAGAVAAPFISGLVVKFPWIVTVLTIMGAFRAVAKPIFSAVEVGLGPDSSLAKKLRIAESGPIYKSAVWLLDFFFSVKAHVVVPEKK